MGCDVTILACRAVSGGQAHSPPAGSITDNRRWLHRRQTPMSAASLDPYTVCSRASNKSIYLAAKLNDSRITHAIFCHTLICCGVWAGNTAAATDVSAFKVLQ